MIERPKRRWFAFSLRTLFVVLTALAIWFGWNLYLVRQRKETARYLIMQGGVYVFDYASEAQPLRPWKPLPLLFSWLGAEPVARIHLPKSNFSDEDRQQLQSLFPEATVLLME